ncbi:adenylate/guanylate cyclase domain-containing protein [Solitalea canadensis]|uniref:Family 3 adenylate cyclase n=1 Tax=Solitalea canadensis (strain ATCC 29591 / DSM 3403 / JCM 21819 / LMG 8368 / NBRC 15130 / NCIMB 12057 / USAM 9D) TaxID=929556 RepID=H8KUL1_SOLCM|nr:adenylate/guanylate cyclase domain-containing protein [Solitalea canadensis]AFD07435.1 family 3 adenylate cyclase [Solitalea canadensis DSM 3403]
MKFNKIIICALLISVPYYGISQTENTKNLADTVQVNNYLQQSKERFNDNPAKAISLAIEAKKLAEKIKFPKGRAYALKNIGIAYYFQGKYVEALDNYTQSLNQFKEIKDNVGIANLYNNIGVIYYDQGDDAKALENYLQSLKYAELSKDKLRILSALNNVGGVYNIKDATYDKALHYYLLALPLCEELNRTEELGAISVNIGSIYFDKNDDTKALHYFNKALKAYGNSEGSLNAYNAMGKLYKREKKYDQALENHQKALALAENLNIKISIIQSLIGMGNVYLDKGDFKTALYFFNRAKIPALEIQAKHEIKDIYQVLSKVYAKTNNYEKAFEYQSLYANIKDTLYNIESDKKLGNLQFDFDLQKKQGEINLLTKDKALQQLALERQKIAKNSLIAVLGLICIIGLILYRDYRNKIRLNKLLDQQKVEIENLLANILPEEVAKELKEKGQATPRYYESVSVLFTDFKSFTAIAETLSPQQVVAELSECFTMFDTIIERNNLEKIKTIGDSYMCAGGIPTVNSTHPINIMKAAFEILGFMNEINNRRKLNGATPWEIRIGIHTGPLVAGVVGKKKYAYDIWGSTVNIASRMESNGEPGQINISAAHYELIKHEYECEYRGKILAKNAGEIDMYFVKQKVTVRNIEVSA